MATKEQKERPATNLDADLLPGWRDGAAKRAILEFVQASEVVPAEERVAVFDNDGTLWCEKPMPIQLDFILRRLVEMAEAAPIYATANRGRRHTSVTTAGSAPS